MIRKSPRNFALTVGLASLTLALAACGGGSDSAASAEPEAATTEETVTTLQSEATEQLETETDTSNSESTGPAAAPGTGTLRLDDGRSYAITISECEFQPSGTFEIKGTSDQGSTFDMTQFYLNDEWFQSDASVEFSNRDQIYVIVSSATEGAEPATVSGKTVTWTQTFKELDESANAHVYSGEGALGLTCP